MHGENFLQDLAIVMIVAGLVTVIFHRLKQPVVLGYILAGVLIGPHLVPLIPNRANIQILSELGVIFLLFSLGLEFNLRKLRTTGVTAFIAATFKILVMLWAGYEIGRVAGWNKMNSLFLGAILSISSTTIIIKTLQDLGKSKDAFAEAIYGILIVEDILAILMIAMLTGFAKSGSLPTADVFRILLQLGVFLVSVLVVGLLAVPRLLNYVSRFKSDEMLLVSVLGLCFCVSLLAAKLGYSVALGAFLIGAIIAESRAIGRIEELLRPVRDMFSAVFFVSIGMLINPKLLMSHLGLILTISFVMVIGKSLACALGAFIAGNDRASALRIGMGLVPIGEFSFIIAALGLTLNVTGDFLYPISVSISAITILLMPYLLRSADPLIRGFDRATAIGKFLDIYTNWIGQLRTTNNNNIALTLVRKWALQMALNVVLISGIFLSAPYFQRKTLNWWPRIPGGETSLKSMLWLGAMILSLPMIIAVFRKLQATGMLLSEVSVTRKAAGSRTDALRTIVSNIILIAGSIALFQIILLLSSAILPSWNIFFVLALLIFLTAIMLRRPFIRIYATAQIALRETFLQPAPLRTHRRAEEALLGKGSELATIQIAQHSPAAGKLISELQLRSTTGASIVGIERAGENIVNPDPHEEIHVGDQLLILGTREQLGAASAFLN